MLTLVAPALGGGHAGWVGRVQRGPWWVVPAVAAACADYVLLGVRQFVRARRTRYAAGRV